MRRLEFFHTTENATDTIPAASRAQSRPAQTAVRVRDGMESKVNSVEKECELAMGCIDHERQRGGRR